MRMREPRAARPLFQALKDCILMGKEEMDVPTVHRQDAYWGQGTTLGSSMVEAKPSREAKPPKR